MVSDVMTNAGVGGDKVGRCSQGHYGLNKMDTQMVRVSDVYCAIKMQFIDRGHNQGHCASSTEGKIKMPMSGRFSRQNCRETFHSGS